VKNPPHREILDRPGLDPAVVERALGELARVNRLLLGYRPLLATLLPRLVEGPERPMVVDLGTGSGDAAERLRRAAERRRLQPTVIGVDRQLTHLLVGRRRGARQLRVVADARALPFADGAVDWSLSTLLFHHFGGDDNREILAEMARVARRGAAVVDLRASRLGRWVGRVLIPLTGAGPITRHDGRLSLAAAWEMDDVRRLVGDGLELVELRRRFPFRFSLVARRRGVG
jgi:SAM-dependent methyltransferase